MVATLISKLQALGRFFRWVAASTLGMLLYLKEELGRYLRETTIHGLSYIATQRNILGKLFWVLVVIAGFACTYLLCKMTLSDWAEHPFVTNVEMRPITEVQFPTVTVCQNPHTEPDKWALISMMANAIKFECYDDRYPHCNETEETRNHPAIKELLNIAVEGIVKNIHKWPTHKLFFETYPNKEYELLASVTFREAVDIAKHNLGRHQRWQDIPWPQNHTKHYRTVREYFNSNSHK